jgi:hypothetical protein
VRWQKAWHWQTILDAITVTYDDLVEIDGTMMRVLQHGATAKKGGPEIMARDVPEGA